MKKRTPRAANLCTLSIYRYSIMLEEYGREGLTAADAKEERNIEEGSACADDLERPWIKNQGPAAEQDERAHRDEGRDCAEAASRSGSAMEETVSASSPDLERA